MSFLFYFPFYCVLAELSFRGIYDYDYMDYTIRVLAKCSDYGFKVFMDPHQDTVRPFSPFHIMQR